MRSFMFGLVVALSLTTATSAFAGDATLWAENPTQEQLWTNFGTLLDGSSQVFGGLPPFKFETKLVDKSHSVFAVPGGENTGTVLVDYLAKPQGNEVDSVSFGPDESKCEDPSGKLTVLCEDMDSTDSGFLPTYTIASID